MKSKRSSLDIGTARGRTGGFSLIELLVAVLVMGIGVLGVTALQMVSLQNNRMALERGDAVQLAYDMSDRVRANADADYETDLGDPPPDPPGDYCTGVDAGCSELEMMNFDLASWKCLLGDHRDDQTCIDMREAGVIPALDEQPGLPNGDGAIEWDGSVMIVTVRWTSVDGEDQTVVIESQL